MQEVPASLATRRGTNTTPPPAAPSASTLGFTGQEDEPELSLVNMQGRVYDPRIGRFLTADPHVSPGRAVGWNPYAYANDSPLRFVDPSGFDGEDAGAAPSPPGPETWSQPEPDDVYKYGPYEWRIGDQQMTLVNGAAAAPQTNPTTTPTQGAKEAGGTKPDTGGEAPVAVTADDSSGARYVTRGGAAPIATPLSVVESLKGGARNATVEAIEHTVDSIRPRGPLVWMVPATLQSRIRPISLDALKVAAPQGGVDREWYNAGHTFARVGEVGLAVIAPMLGGGGAAVVATEAAEGSAAAAATEALVEGGGMATVRQLGAEGEAAVRAATDIGPKTAVDIGGRTRIPDGLTDAILTEVKNVG